MLEVVTVVFLALGCAGVFGVGRLCSRMLAALESLEVSIRALVPAAEAPGGRADAEQARDEQGVANILAYGTREMVRRRGDVQ